MTMLKSKNLLDHDGRWITSDSEEQFPPAQNLESFDTCEEAIAYARENPDECQTHVGKIEAATPERLFATGVVEDLLDNAILNFCDGWLGDLDPDDIASWTKEDVEAIRQAVLAVVRERKIVGASYLVDGIQATGVPGEFDDEEEE